MSESGVLKCSTYVGRLLNERQTRGLEADDSLGFESGVCR
ncbi:hypothetical protein HSB1_04360 [Halogranum salarium B-1]|uniref:Uncharacterized protein n=1 Tax=Halogranum salarium B-1 TaxID=1210908 RepID=J2ZKZ2_9EURY|nr:hypothetical protein HSB1_04360 [Halogranum salarium B-1]